MNRKLALATATALLLTIQAPNVLAADIMRVGFASACPASKIQPETPAAIGVAILANLAGQIVGGAVDALATYLTAQENLALAATYRTKALVAGDGKDVKLSSDNKCIVVAVAEKFGPRQTGKAVVSIPADVSKLSYFGGDTVADSNEVKQALYNSLGLLSAPKLYFEAALSVTPDGKAWGFTPGYWYYSGFLAPDSWRYKNERDIVLQFDFSEPGKPAFGTTKFQWLAIDAPTLSGLTIVGDLPPWMAFPEGIASAATTGPSVPVNVSVTYGETAKPHTLLKYIGDALSSQKSAIVDEATSAVTQALSQQARADARGAALTALSPKLKAYYDAFDTATKAASDYKAATTDADRKKLYALAQEAYAQFDVSKTSAALAYHLTGLGGFPELTLEPLSPPK